MMRTIWKYKIPIVDVFSIEMPEDSKILHADVQDGQPCIWVEVPVNQAGMIRRVFYLLGTGNIAMDLINLKYVGTFQMIDDKLVWHLYTVVN